jgi:hypothetical protein
MLKGKTERDPAPLGRVDDVAVVGQAVEQRGARLVLTMIEVRS